MFHDKTNDAEMFKCCSHIDSVFCFFHSGLPFKCEIDRRQQSEMEYYGEEMSTSSQEFEDIGLREEKALSDSEIKVHMILSVLTSCSTDVIADCYCASFYVKSLLIFNYLTY